MGADENARHDGDERQGATMVEGSHYLPLESIRSQLQVASRATSLCAGKGIAGYYTVAVQAVLGRVDVETVP